MTDAEALVAAVARWGSAAVVHVESTQFADGAVAPLYCVGRLHDAFSWSVLGQSLLSWESAFADAEQREHRRRPSSVGLRAGSRVSATGRGDHA